MTCSPFSARTSADRRMGSSRLRLLFSSLLFLTVCSPASPVCAKPSIGSLDGMIISVSDGDHLTFSNNGTEINVRLYGIKAPVIAKIRRDEPWHTQPGQRFAGRAFMALARKVLHKQARLEIMQLEDIERAVAVVFVDGRNINLELLAEGWAWAARGKRKPEEPEYAAAEELARSRKIGLWVQDNPQPPWEFKQLGKAEHPNIW